MRSSDDDADAFSESPASALASFASPAARGKPYRTAVTWTAEAQRTAHVRTFEHKPTLLHGEPCCSTRVPHNFHFLEEDAYGDDRLCICTWI